MEVMCGPLLQTLENRLQVNLKRTAALETEKETLDREIEKLKTELQASRWNALYWYPPWAKVIFSTAGFNIRACAKALGSHSLHASQFRFRYWVTVHKPTVLLAGKQVVPAQNWKMQRARATSMSHSCPRWTTSLWCQLRQRQASIITWSFYERFCGTWWWKIFNYLGQIFKIIFLEWQYFKI